MNARTIQVEAAGLSDQGEVRERNEDAFLVDRARGLYLVADGMGGHRGGGIAAQAVAMQLPLLVERQLRDANNKPTKALQAAILELNSVIRATGKQCADLHGMGSTLACLLIYGGRAYIANMGDSRVYQWRKGKLKCLTQDHSVTALLVREGEISARSAVRHPARGQLTRYVGMELDIYPDVSSVQVRASDRFLLCTDGLWNVLPDKQIAKLLADDGNPEAICANLIDAAKAGKSRDNITTVVVQCS